MFLICCMKIQLLMMFSSESNFTTKNRHLTQCVDKNRPLKFKYSSLLRWSSSSISNYHPEVLYDKVRNAPQAIRRVWGFENFHLISGQNKGGVVVTLFAGKISLRFKMMTTTARCLKITEKVSFNIASEASYVYIFSGQKLLKNAKNGPFWRVFENLKLAVKQCYQTGQF